MEGIKKGAAYLDPKSIAVHVIKIVNPCDIVTLCGHTFDIYHAGTYVYHEDALTNCEKCRRELALAYKEAA